MASNCCPPGWRMVKLRDLGEVNRGRSRHRPRYAEHLYNGRYPFIQTGDIKASEGRITTYRQTYSEAGLEQSRLWPSGTMCITIAANIAETGILAFPACFPDSVIGFIADEAKCDVYLIEYIFRHLRRRIQHEATGSVQDNINLATLDRLQFPLSPLSEQHAIAHILGTLDDKIELNRKMNETLEAMARAIFKSWFVDFLPVRAKAEGRKPSGMGPETAALFPDSFQDSPLGKIPEGWEAGTLGDIAENVKDSIKPEHMENGTPYIALDHMPRRSISLSEWAIADGVASNKYRFNKGEILFGKLRPYFHKVGVTPLGGVCSTDILVIRPPTPEWFGPALGTISSDEFVAYTDAVSTGTKMPRTNWKDMSRYEVPIPRVEIAKEYSGIIKPLIDRIVHNIHQSRTLAEIRDALLPKLLSGEIRVKDVEKFVEESV